MGPYHRRLTTPRHSSSCVFTVTARAYPSLLWREPVNDLLDLGGIQTPVLIFQVRRAAELFGRSVIFGIALDHLREKHRALGSVHHNEKGCLGSSMMHLLGLSLRIQNFRCAVKGTRLILRRVQHFTMEAIFSVEEPTCITASAAVSISCALGENICTLMVRNSRMLHEISRAFDRSAPLMDQRESYREARAEKEDTCGRCTSSSACVIRRHNLD